MHSVDFHITDLLKRTICSASTRATLKRHHESATDVAHDLFRTAKKENFNSGARQFHREWRTNIELNVVSLRKHQIERQQYFERLEQMNVSILCFIVYFAYRTTSCLLLRQTGLL